MNIIDVYQKMNVPKNLQRHMLRVAAIGQYLAQNWKDPIDGVNVVDTLLLHDLGNLLKFDLSRGLQLLDEDERNFSHWTSIQSEMKKKYSTDEHEATRLMAREIGVEDRVLFLLSNMGSSNLQETVESKDWELKICSYSDFRVGPHGFLTVEERFQDILLRYEGRNHALSEREKTLDKMRLCFDLEKQLQPMLNIDLHALPSELLEANSQMLKSIEI